VTGIGFIGGGLIFVRKEDVRGLTTAATIWLAAAVGMACGASLPLLATIATGAYFVVAVGYAPVAQRLPRSRHVPSHLHLSYRDGVGALRGVLVACAAHDFRVGRLEVVRERPEAVEVVLEVVGHGAVAELVAAVSEVPGVLSAGAGDANEPVE
jgi:putative Mg2+ transporter-C (MgtC) family protein